MRSLWISRASASVNATLSPDGKLGYLVGMNAVILPGSDGKLVTTRGRATSPRLPEPGRPAAEAGEDLALLGSGRAPCH